jgi:hypothetical protein
MHVDELIYAGLILPDARDMDSWPYLSETARVMAQIGQDQDQITVDDAHGLVMGPRMGLVITPQEDSDFGPRILLQVVPRSDSPSTAAQQRDFLAICLREMLDWSPADIVEWGAATNLIDAEDFALGPAAAEISVTSAEDPFAAHDLRLSIREEDAAAPLEETLSAQDRLRARVVERPADELRLSAAGWIISIMIALVALPVAAFLWVVSLVRGMDFRLATQALSVTLLFLALQNSDWLHSFVNTVLH